MLLGVIQLKLSMVMMVNPSFAVALADTEERRGKGAA